MGFFDKIKNSLGMDEEEALPELVLKNLQKGWLLDYDLKTWEVQAYNVYDWDGDLSHEWQLMSGDEVRFLELETDDTDDWSFNRKIAFGRLGSGVKKSIQETGDPPSELGGGRRDLLSGRGGRGSFQKGRPGPGPGGLALVL